MARLLIGSAGTVRIEIDDGSSLTLTSVQDILYRDAAGVVTDLSPSKVMADVECAAEQARRLDVN